MAEAWQRPGPRAALRDVDARINDALAGAFDRIDNYVRSGDLTDGQVARHLDRGWGEVIADAWAEYVSEDTDGGTPSTVYIKEANDL